MLIDAFENNDQPAEAASHGRETSMARMPDRDSCGTSFQAV